jgi:hypothetical protein
LAGLAISQQTQKSNVKRKMVLFEKIFTDFLFSEGGLLKEFVAFLIVKRLIVIP